MYQHDLSRTGNAVSESVLGPANAREIARVWASDANRTLGIVSGSLTVAGGFLYAGSWNGRLYELDAANGHQLWNLSLSSPYHTLVFSNPSTYWNEGGISSTPTIVSNAIGNTTYNTLYVDAGSTFLYAINASTQSPGAPPVVLWKQNTTSYSALSNGPTEWGYHYLWSSPVVSGNFAYVGLAALYDGAPVQGQLLQVPILGSNHAPVHLFNVTGQTLATNDVEGSIWSTPSVDTGAGTIWVATGNNNYPFYSGIQPLTQSILALNLSNVSEMKGSYRATEPASGPGDFDYGAGPTLFSNASGATLAGAINKDGGFYAYNRTSFTSTSCANDSNLAGGHCLVPAWGGRIPQLASNGYPSSNSISPAAFGGGRLFVAGGNTASTYVGGSITALDPSNGTVDWRILLHGETPLAGLTYANGLLIAAMDSGTGQFGAYGPGRLLVLNAANGTVLRNLTLNQSIAGEPIVSDGRIFVGTGNFSTLSGANATGWIDAFGVPLTVSASIASPSDANGTVRLAGQVNGGMPGYRCTWDFGDGSAASEVANPTHQFPRPGTYSVTWTCVDLAGESASVVLSVAVVYAGTAVISRDPVDLGAPTSLSITPNSSSTSFAVVWAGLPLGCVSANVLLLGCTPGEVGTFQVRAFWNASGGGHGEIPLPLLIVNPRLALAVHVGWIAALSPLGIAGTAVSSGGTPPYGVAWNLGDGSPTVTTSAFEHVYARPGTYVVSASGYDAGGGSALVSVNATVADPLEALLAGPAPVTDVGVATHLNLTIASGFPPYEVRWTGLPTGCPSANSTSLTCVPRASGEFVLLVEASDAHGENASAIGALVVSPALGANASASVGPSNRGCGDKALVQLFGLVSGGTAPDSYSWTAANGTQLGTGPSSQTWASPSDTSRFTFVVDDAVGARASVNLSVYVPPVGCPTPGHGAPAFGLTATEWSGIAGSIVVAALGAVFWTRRRRRDPALAPRSEKDAG